MHVYKLTEVGKQIAKTKSGDDEELRALKFIKDRKTVTDQELEGHVETYIVRHLVRENLVQQLN